MKLALALALGTMLVLQASAGRADDTEDEARTAMRRGLQAYAEGDAEAALAEYETAKRLAPAANAPYFHAGEALAKLGRWREAVESFEAYIAKDPTVSDSAAVKDRIASIRAN